jgi:hypothetical protein
MKWAIRAVAATGLMTVLMSGASFAAEASMTLEFSWRGVTPCKTLADSPAFKLRNVPHGAKRVHLSLTEGARELGGQTLDLPDSSEIPAGALRTYSPCNPTYYRWTAAATSASGQVLGQAFQTRFFPTDEILPTQ